MYEVTLCHPVEVFTEDVFYFYQIHSGSAETAVSKENLLKKIRSHVRITQILQGYYQAMENPVDGSANKLMSFLWTSLYGATKLPRKEAKSVIRELHSCGLFPCRRPAHCNMETSYMTDTSSLIGRIFDKVYMNLHTRWGYMAMRLLQKLR